MTLPRSLSILLLSAGLVSRSRPVARPQPLTAQQAEGKHLYEVRCAHCHEENDLQLKKVPPDLHRSIQGQHASQRRTRNRRRSPARCSRRQRNDAGIQRPLRRCANVRAAGLSAYRLALDCANRPRQTSLIANRPHRVNARCAPGRNHAGECRHQRKNERGGEQEQGIARTLRRPACHHFVQRQRQSTPATIPVPTLATVDRNTMPRTCPFFAPSAMRMPNSFVRCTTV